jgi:hypothetical protein
MRMIPQILVEDDLMDESDVALPVVFRLRRGKSNVEGKVMVRAS